MFKNGYDYIVNLLLSNRRLTVEEYCTTVDGTGITVAHLAARCGLLRDDFKYWYISTYSGWTVMHDYIENIARIPLGTIDWALADSDGWSIAHAAAKHDILPDTFNQWSLMDNMGQSVGYVLTKGKSIPINMHRLGISNGVK